MIQKLLISTGLLLATVSLTLALPAPAAAQGGTQVSVVDMVNALRAEYGLPPYQIDPALMAAAQAHSEWAASIGTHSHSGIGGSTPKDRAIAAGYGGGRTVRVSENIYWGTNATPQSALEWWRNSPIHFQGMTSTNYLNIGAGVAYSDSGGFFTLEFGIVTGDAPAAPAASSSGSNANVEELPVYVVEPIERVEPAEDGSIIHTVGEGQTLWGIAEAYEVPLSEILALNRMTESTVLQPGDEVVVVPVPIEAQAASEGPIVHTVQPGQTLYELSLTYGIALDDILQLNGLTQTSVIRPDDEILIKPGPDGENPIVRGPLIHTVQPGDTLGSIAFLYGIDLQTLLDQNGLDENSFIFEGDELLIRPGDPTPMPTIPPTLTPRPTQAAEVAPTPSEVSAEDSAAIEKEPRGASRGWMIFGLVLILLGGVALVGVGILRRSPSDESGID